MKLHYRTSLRSAVCLHTAACLLLGSLLLTSCSKEDTPEETSAPLSVLNPDGSSDTTTPSIQNNTINNNYYVSTPGDETSSNTPTNTPSGTINIGNSSLGNESKNLTFVSNGNGTCTLAGIGTCADACLVIPSMSDTGDRVTAISEKAFYGNTTVTAVFIPASVSFIGAQAFAAMPSLAYFSVDAQNLSYRSESGVLYTKDGSTLLTYPAAKNTSILSLPASVRIIADMAFYGCSRLSGIAYEGAPTDWQRIIVGSGNNSLIGLSVQYNSVSGK